MTAVLLVDDEFDLLACLRDVLEDEGYQVVTAQNGREALTQLDAHQVDLVVTDLMMPVMSGVDLLRHLRADPRRPDLPTLVVSAGLNRRIVEQLDSPYLRKPFDLDAFVAEVRRLAGPP